MEAYVGELLDAMPDASFMVDSAGRIVLLNRLAETMFGYSGRQMRGQPLAALIPERFRGAHAGHCSNYFARPRARAMGAGLSLRALRKDGAEFPVEISLSPVRTDQGTYVIGAVRDISQSEQRYRAVFEHVAVGVVHSNTEGRLLDVNPKFCDLSGYTREEALALSIRDLTHQEDMRESLRERTRSVEGVISGYERETRLIRKDGTEIWALIATSLVRAADGRPLHFISLVHDISRQKYAELERHESELRFRQIAENIREVFFLTNATGAKTLYVSPAYEEIWGRRSASLYRNPQEWVDAIHPSDRPGVLAAMQQQQRTGQLDYEYQIVRPDKTIRWIHARTFPIHDDEGNLVRIAGIAEDVTERKLAADRLRESQRRFTDMLQRVELISLMLDRDARITYCNDFLLRLTGWTREEVFNRSWFELFVPPEATGSMTGIFSSLLANRSDAWHHENEILTRSGERRLIRWSNTLLRSSTGEITGTASIGEDITEKARAEEEIRRYTLKLERAVQGTIEVVSTIGELRDPYTHGHEHRVGELATAIATAMGLAADQIEGVKVAGYLHDVGKIAVPAEILSKPGRLSKAEFELVKQHAQQSYEILKRVEFPWPVAEAAWQHHERLDGSGYPRGLKGEDIILEARILAVADTVEAMSSHRPYRPGLGIDKALAEIERGSGTIFDPQVSDACVRLFREKNYQLPA